jgi:hypothetical protein
MARRNLIHRKHLSLLRMYFRNTGWTLLEPKGPWEVFRANRLDHKRPIIVYRSFNSEHFTIEDRDYRIFAKFLQWMKSKEDKEN